MKIIADLVNRSLSTVFLEGGAQLGPANSRHARLTGVTLTDFDQRRLASLGNVSLLNSKPFVEPDAQTAEPIVTEHASAMTTQHVNEAQSPDQLADEQSGSRRDKKR